MLILENIRSAYNVGSIFRCADAAGIKKIILVGYTPTPENPKVAKTALGAEKTVPWVHTWNISKNLVELKKKKFQIIALELTKKAKAYTKIRPRGPIAMVIGNEVDGVSSDTLKQATIVAKIPMRGKKESLNASHAAAIVLFHLAQKFVGNK